MENNNISIGTALLLDLSKKIASGEAVWSLLRINEYRQQSSSPITDALTIKAVKEIEKLDKSLSTKKVIEKIINGACLRDLSQTEKGLLKRKINNSAAVEMNFSKRKIPALIPWNIKKNRSTTKIDFKRKQDKLRSEHFL